MAEILFTTSEIIDPIELFANVFPTAKTGFNVLYEYYKWINFTSHHLADHFEQCL